MANVNDKAGADPKRLFLKNQTESYMIANYEAREAGITTDTNFVAYKDNAGTFKKLALSDHVHSSLVIPSTTTAALTVAATTGYATLQNADAGAGMAFKIGSAGANSGVYVGEIDFITSGTAQVDKRVALIASQLTDASGTVPYADLEFHTANGAAPEERMRILSTGNVCIGATTGSSKLNVIGGVHIGSTGTLSDAGAGNLIVDGEITGGGLTASKIVGTDANKKLVSLSFGSSAGSICEGNDSRLSDARTPTAHVHSSVAASDGSPDPALSFDATGIGSFVDAVVMADNKALYFGAAKTYGIRYDALGTGKIRVQLALHTNPADLSTGDWYVDNSGYVRVK